MKLSVFNPSDYPRGGHVSAPWPEIAQHSGIGPGSLVVRDSRGTVLPHQVVQVDPDDRSRDTLVFALHPGHKVPAARLDDYSESTDWVSLEEGRPDPTVGVRAIAREIRGPDGTVRAVELTNGILTVWLNLGPFNCGASSRPCYGGSAVSVRVGDIEMLDPLQSMVGPHDHDPEKRAMQIDRVRVVLPGWEEQVYHEEPLFARSWAAVSTTMGPVRAIITIASEPFEYACTDLATATRHRLDCRLYRTISLSTGANCLVEELFVKGSLPGSADGRGAIRLSFAARYFAHMYYGHLPPIYHFRNIPDWFAIAYGDRPYPGYGFATDAHASPVAYPHEGHERRFSWWVWPSKTARCLHLFLANQPGHIDSATGHCWYEMIYRPLKAEIAKEP